MEDPGPPGGREVQPGGTGLSQFYGCGKAGPAEEDSVSEVSEAELREFFGELGAEVEEPGVGGTPLFLPTPDFMASAGTV